MRALSRWALILLILAAPAVASAHVAPSADTDNRYLDVTPMADRVRFAYTILVGEAPGKMARHALDRDRDGQVSEAESDAWASDLAERVRAGLEVRIDGHTVPVTWAETYVGMDDRSTDAGAFSLDLIAYLCAPAAAAKRTVDIRDPFALTPPGETEVRLSQEPGITVEVAKVGAGEISGRVARFEGLAAPLTEGFHMVYAIGADARAVPDGKCAAPRAPKAAGATGRWLLFGGIFAVVALSAVAVIRRRRRI
jgi:hypothetical protein